MSSLKMYICIDITLSDKFLYELSEYFRQWDTPCSVFAILIFMRRNITALIYSINCYIFPNKFVLINKPGIF